MSHTWLEEPVPLCQLAPGQPPSTLTDGSHGVGLTARGGGTSCAGNAVGEGIVIDFSRHMNQILAIDPVSCTAIVQPGVILSDLQQQLSSYGLRFGPDPSTATRCTLGGMIGNNACGPHGLSYGRTADNVKELRWLLTGGEIINAACGPRIIGEVPGIEEFMTRHMALLRTEFGRFDRQISGYSLEHLLPENGRNLAAALTGTEGTCGILLAATLKLVPQNPSPALVVLGYADMAIAADDVPALLPFKPLALEGLDAQLVQVIRNAKGSSNLPELPAGGGWLMIEVGGATPETALENATSLVDASSAIDSQIFPMGSEARKLWQIRADGAGLAGRTSNGEQAWPGWEDSAVPPSEFGNYLRGLFSLMEAENLTGLAYGHFGDGCIHLRINFPLESKPYRFRRFMEQAAKLAADHGGSMSGEHGDGRARSELLPTMYSAEALQAMTEFKRLLDPTNIMNPGIVVRPDPLDANLRRPQAATLMASDGFLFSEDHGNITNSVHRCVGVGKCRADLRSQGGFMCPSYSATRNEKDSTRGRARILQEMINGKVITLGPSAPEVHEALDLCLSCKACASDCPTGIDMATFKSEILHRSYTGKIRPLTHYTLGRLPQWLKFIAPFARLVNFAGAAPVIRRLMMHALGADPRRSLPRLPHTPFRHRKTVDVPSPSSDAPKVLLWVDSFTDAITPAIAEDALAVLKSAGCDVKIASSGACCGLTLISTGQLTAAKKTLTRTLDLLHPALQEGRKLIGLEPSCTATLRSDLVELLRQDPRAHELSQKVYSLAEFLESIQWVPPRSTEEILIQPHCHQHAIMGYEPDLRLLKQMGCTIEISSGCCGLAGNFGMEKGHYEVSRTIAEQGILAKAASHPSHTVLADGFSCRTQLEDLARISGLHLAQLLARRLEKTQTQL